MLSKENFLGVLIPDFPNHMIRGMHDARNSNAAEKNGNAITEGQGNSSSIIINIMKRTWNPKEDELNLQYAINENYKTASNSKLLHCIQRNLLKLNDSLDAT